MADVLPLRKAPLEVGVLSSRPWVFNFWILFWEKLPLSLKKSSNRIAGWYYNQMRKHQVIGGGEKWWLREDGWLQELEATGGQDVPLLVEACWRTGHDVACVCERERHCQSLLKHICWSRRRAVLRTRIQIFHDQILYSLNRRTRSTLLQVSPSTIVTVIWQSAALWLGLQCV